ncbi:hypothetical protein ES288_A12G009100v1 [Gossypium darwinii]|nr:hypothetical protein ES288_A12G009100v1 [Gossypium darwinii]TYH93966.1 hypothetical protein ES332_A12G009200v1 [Gossypium tomentosum]
MADVQDIDGKPCEEKLPSTSLKHETRDEILSRHRKEISQLQNKEIELKKAAAKGSKAEQKAKKKQVEEEISQLSANLKEKHAEELASLGFSYNGNDKSNTDNLVKAIAGLSVAPQAQQEAAREQRIQEEQSSIMSDRMIEDEKFERKLKPLGFTIKEIKSDGHCPYRAVEDQLSLQSGDSSPYAYQELREMAAAYMRKHIWMTHLHRDSRTKEVESTAAWGGQLELGALTHSLRKHIVDLDGAKICFHLRHGFKRSLGIRLPLGRRSIHRSDRRQMIGKHPPLLPICKIDSNEIKEKGKKKESFPDVEMGKEYKSDGGSSSSTGTIRLSYHKHAFGRGEHYNSVFPHLNIQV